MGRCPCELQQVAPIESFVHNPQRFGTHSKTLPAWVGLDDFSGDQTVNLGTARHHRLLKDTGMLVRSQATVLQNRDQSEQVCNIERADQRRKIGRQQRLHVEHSRFNSLNLAEPDVKRGAKHAGGLPGQCLEESVLRICLPLKQRFNPL